MKSVLCNKKKPKQLNFEYCIFIIVVHHSCSKERKRQIKNTKAGFYKYAITKEVISIQNS